VAPHAPSQYSASVRGGPSFSLLSPSVGVGHSPLAVGLGPSAGLLVGVPDRRPVSPLSSPRACSGAGPGWHGCGWIAVSAAFSEGPSPWHWSLLMRCPPTSLLSPLAGVGHCSLAIGHGPSAGLLVSVPDRQPVSPLSSPRACSGAGQGWHGCGWIAASAVLSEGPAPWRWPLFVRCPLGRHRGGGSPAARGCAGHGTPGRARPASWSEHHRGCAFGQAAVSPYRASGRPGQVDCKGEPGVALGGHGHAHPINRPLASSLAAGGAAVGCVTSYRHSSQTPGGPGAGAGWLRTRMPALAGPDHEAIMAHDCSGHEADLARAECDRLTRAG
jgi:hypothetical protein